VRRWWKWVALGFLVLILLLAGGILIAGRYFEPYIRELAIQYLQQRFDSEVELSKLQVQMPGFSAVRLLLHGNVALVDVAGEHLVLRHKGRRDIPPLFALRRFGATLDLGTLFSRAKSVPLVSLEGMEITLPPKEERPKFDMQPSSGGNGPGVEIGSVIIHDAKFTILPRDKSRTPLEFDLHDVHLNSVAKNSPMRYQAYLTIPKPKGQINSSGNFGPWVADVPSETPLTGDYLFENADLGVFNGIAGILKSTGHFEGQLGTITAKGEATVPDFRL
jgi:hypothetical protein